MQENKPILIVGLGNPGAQYERTRHNVGFMAVQSLVPSDAKWRMEHDALTYTQNINGRRVIFALPQTFMNNSGAAVGALVRFYKIPIENITVIHDDMDLKSGNVRRQCRAQWNKINRCRHWFELSPYKDWHWASA